MKWGTQQEILRKFRDSLGHTLKIWTKKDWKIKKTRQFSG